jgi:hypothetical protein
VKARNTPQKALFCGWSALFPLLYVLTSAVSGVETVALPVAQDTTLFEWNPLDNMGNQRDLPAGTLGNMGDRKRARLLFQVDLASGLPPGGEIVAARFRILLTMAPESGRADSVFALHRISVPWGEGDKRGDLPGGDTATEGEANWNARFHPDQLWSVPGGALGSDYVAEPSAGTQISSPKSYVMEFNAQGLADLSAMLAEPESNHGWVLLTHDEERAKTARRFAAREHRTEPPMLEIDYELPAEAISLVPQISHDAETGEITISTEATADKVYTLQSSSRLESIDWENEETEWGFVMEKVTFKKLLNDSLRFFRIVEGPSVR